MIVVLILHDFRRRNTKQLAERARDEIWSAMYRNGDDEDASQSFITRDRLQGVWLETQGQDACLLDEFRQYMPTRSRGDVKDHLLSIYPS